MSDYRTSKGRLVRHCHIGLPGCQAADLSPGEVAQIRSTMASDFPQVSELAPPTWAYNCHGYAHTNSHGWFDDPVPFITDDYVQATMAHPRVGDIVVYMKDGDHTHSAVVFLTAGNQITALRSKWGAWGLYAHQLSEVPDGYGEPMYLLRRPQRERGEPMSDRVEIAVATLGERKTYLKVALASTPSVARRIIQELPDVRDVVALGDAAAAKVLEVFERADVRANDMLAGILLYCLQIHGVRGAVSSVARFIVERPLTMITREMAPAAFLVLAGISIESESPLDVALREAPRFARLNE
jgi:hypothetical protein